MKKISVLIILVLVSGVVFSQEQLLYEHVTFLVTDADVFDIYLKVQDHGQLYLDNQTGIYFVKNLDFKAIVEYRRNGGSLSSYQSGFVWQPALPYGIDDPADMDYNDLDYIGGKYSGITAGFLTKTGSKSVAINTIAMHIVGPTPDIWDEPHNFGPISIIADNVAPEIKAGSFIQKEENGVFSYHLSISAVVDKGYSNYIASGLKSVHYTKAGSSTKYPYIYSGSNKTYFSQSGVYTIIAEDNVGNTSLPVVINIDKDAPIISWGTISYSSNPNDPTGYYSVSIPFSVSDGVSGTGISNDYTIKEYENNTLVRTYPRTVSVTTIAKSDCTPGKSYRIELTATDDFVFPNSATSSISFGLPVLPVFDSANNSISWNMNNTSARINGTLQLINNQSMGINSLRIYSEDKASLLYTFSGTQITAINNIMKGSGSTAYSFYFDIDDDHLVFHEPLGFVLRTGVVVNSNTMLFDKEYTLSEAIANRTPNNSETETLHFGNDEGWTLDLGNDPSLYADEWLFVPDGDFNEGLHDFILQKEAESPEEITSEYLSSFDAISLSEFEDYDGDTISLIIVEPEENGPGYLVLNEYYDHVGSTFHRYYLLPYRLLVDSAAPVFDDIALNDADGDPYETIDINGVTFCPEPPIMAISGIMDSNGIAQISWTFTVNATEQYSYTDSSPVINLNNYSCDWAQLSGFNVDSGETIEGILEVFVSDPAGNFGSGSRTVVIDRQPPAGIANGVDPLIKTEGLIPGADIFYSYDSVTDRITLQFADNFFSDMGPLEAQSFDVTNISVITAITGIDSVDVDAGNNKATIQLSGGYTANSTVQIDFELYDLAGNISPQTLSFALPAELASDGVTIDRGDQPDYDLPFSEWDAGIGHYLEFISTESGTASWDRINIYRQVPETGSWLLVNTINDAGVSVIDSDCQAHETYSYKLVPVNASGFVCESARVLMDSVTLENYSPDVFADFGGLPQREGNVFFGPLTEVGPGSAISCSFSDPDGDSIYTGIMIGEGNVLNIDVSDVNWIAALAGELSDGSTYALGFTVDDYWTLPDETIVYGQIVSSESVNAVYDASAPEYIDGSEEWDNESGTVWGYTGIGITVNDAGCGTGEIVLERYDEDAEIWIPVPADSVSAVIDDTQIHYSLPEGMYELQMRLIDKLGNAIPAPVSFGLVRCDTSSPVVSSVSLANTAGKYQENGVYYYADPLVRAAVSYENTVGELSAVEYQYRSGDTVVSSGSRQVLGQTGALEFTCMPDQSLISQNSEYSLWVCLTDKGGNRSDWVQAEYSVLFDFTAPGLELAGWGPDHNTALGSYLASDQTVALPQVTVSDNASGNGDIGIEYSLRNEDGSLAAVITGPNLSFPMEGRFSLSVTATDQAGNPTGLALPVIYDATAPSVPVVTWLPSAPASCYPGEILSLKIAANDTLCGIQKYSIDISDDNGLLDGIVISPVNASGLMLNIPAGITGTGISFVFRAYDNAGNESSCGISVPVAVPANALSIDVPFYLGAGQPLNANWIFTGDEPPNYYHVTISGSKEFWQGDVEETGLSVPASLLAEVGHGETLVVGVNAVLDSGQELPVSWSHGIKVDYNTPLISDFTVPLISSAAGIPVSWELDDESPLGSVDLFMDTIVDDGENITTQLYGSAPMGLSLSGNVNAADAFGDGIPDETGYIRLRLVVSDMACNMSEAVSAVISIDNTTPPDFQVVDQGDYINPDMNDLYFQWIWAIADSESGTNSYSWQLCDDDGPGSIWETAETNEITIPGPVALARFGNGSEVYLAVQRENGSGLIQTVFSNGIILDTSAPRIVSVKFVNASQIEVDDVFYNSAGKTYLLVTGGDEQSGISKYEAAAGIITGGSFTAVAPVKESTDNHFDVDLPVTAAGDIVQYEVVCYNGVELVSLPSYSAGMIYSPVLPEIGNMVIHENAAGFSGCWAASSQAPLVAQSAELLYENGGATVVFDQADINPAARTVFFARTNPPDGNYKLRLVITDAAGQTIQKISSPLKVDHSPPVVTALDIEPYVYSDMEYTVDTNEGVNQLWARIYSGAQQIYGELLILPAGTNGLETWNDTVDLEALPAWGLLNGGSSRLLTLVVYVRDLQGNWSTASTVNFVFDNSAPSIPVITRDNTLVWGDETIVPDPGMTGYSNRLQGIGISSADDVSPLVSYRYGIAAATGAEPAAWSDFFAVPDPSTAIGLADIEFGNISLADGQEFYPAVQVMNRAGLVSATGYGDMLIADLDAPQFALSHAGCITIDDNGEDPPVGICNGDALLDIQINDEVSRYLEYTMSIAGPAGNSADSATGVIDRDTGDPVTLPVQLNPGEGGNHDVTLTLADLFGRKTAHTIYYRLNSPPVLEIPEVFTVRPAEVLTITFAEWLEYMSDLDGIAQITITRPETADSVTLSTESDEFCVSFDQRNMWDQTSEYGFIITATDGYGAETEAEFSIIVENTHEGELLADEYWSGDHIITGQVTINAGRTLTIAPGTRVLAAAGAIYGTDQRIIVETDGTLIQQGAVTYTLLDPGPGVFWQGLLIRNSTDFDGTVIEHADRAIVAAAGTEFTINNCRFTGNRIGVHALADNLTITDSQFTGNIHYGVKEEYGGDGTGGTNPVMIGNTFLNNGFDYYDYELSVIESDRIDSLQPANTGNGAE
ncbi:MAG: hypothetical protein JW874_09120 [Spirochaetales bacterium]|nr:hypothetical protein [Spirochaetales bacterium]